MKVALLIAVMLASTSVVFCCGIVVPICRSLRRPQARVSTDDDDVFPFWLRRRHFRLKKGVTCQEKEEALQDAAAKLEEVMHGAESESVLELMREFQEVEENDGALSDDTFEKKAASLQEAAADMEEKVNEVEEDAALGLLEEELEELEEELEEAKDDPEE